MRIGIDASRAFAEKKTGVEEYSYQLIKGLTMMDVSSHQVFLYARKNYNIDFDLPPNFSVKEIKNERIWTQIGLSLEMKKNPVDLLFVPSYSIPVIHPKKTVVTIHGLEFKHYPECYSLKDRVFLELNTLLNVKWSSKIIAPSENTKNDLVKFYRVNPDKIKVVYHGISSIKYQVLSIERLNKSSFNILFIGRLERRKNLINLIKAFGVLNSKFKIQDSKFKLTLAGKEGFGFEEIKKTIEQSLYKKDIVLKSYVSEEEKEELYKNADVFILPSLYEGFGLPILEAMSYKTSVICSNTSSLPEIAGGAGLLVNPNDIKEIAMAINRVFSNAGLREKMIKKGFENVKRFSWKKCARETMEEILNINKLTN